MVGRHLGVGMGLLFLGLSSLLEAQTGDTILVRFASTELREASAALDSRRYEIIRPVVPSLGLYLVRVKAGDTQSALTALRNQDAVIYAQEDHAVSLRSTTPSDPEFKDQWGLSNPTSGADIRALGAWKYGKGGKDRGGNDIVIAIVDGGMDITHPDLKDNVFTNRNEIPGNGIDDDGNGYIDDIQGWNAYNNTGKVPSDNHGTHVAGIAGARGDNNLNVVGVNWNVKLLPIAGASSKTSQIASAYGYAIAMKKLWIESKGAKGANIVSTNSSFGVDYADCNSGDYPLWNDLYNEMGKFGILSAAATANMNIDVDKKGDVPTGCKSDYLVTVTNTDKNDKRNSSAGYGKKTILLGAPGTAVLSTLPNSRTGKLTGTSMSTPHVAGAIAFLYSVASRQFYDLAEKNPGQAALVVQDILGSEVDIISDLKDITRSGGRLNLEKAAQAISGWNPKFYTIVDALPAF